MLNNVYTLLKYYKFSKLTKTEKLNPVKIYKLQFRIINAFIKKLTFLKICSQLFCNTSHYLCVDKSFLFKRINFSR